MTIHRVYDKELSAEFWICGETISRGDYIKATQDMIEDEHRFQNLRFVFIDQSNVLKIDVDTEKLPSLVELNKSAARVNPNLCLAVVSRKDILFGLSRMWKALVGVISWQTYVCRNSEEAAEWLVNKIEDLKDPITVLKAAAQADPQK